MYKCTLLLMLLLSNNEDSMHPSHKTYQTAGVHLLRAHDVCSLMRVHLKREPLDDKERLHSSQLQSVPAGELPAERSGAAEGEEQPVVPQEAEEEQPEVPEEAEEEQPVVPEEAEEDGHVWETIVPEDRAHGMLLEWAKALKVMQRRLSQSTLKALWSGLNKTHTVRT
jgi:hypothetical protein